MKKYILFDLDGTLTDPMLGITNSVKYALKKFNITVKDSKELYKFIGPPLKESFINFYNFDNDNSNTAITYYREYFSDKGIYENFIYENLEDMLLQLKKQNKSLIVATSKPIVFAEEILKHFNIDKYFDFISGSNLDGTRTKKADVIKYALDELKIDNLSEVIMIGDREHDIYGAKEIGIDSIGVLYGYGTYDELNQSGATYITKDVNELNKLLTSL